MERNEGNLKKRIAEEMTVEYGDALEKNFDLAKQFIRITREGKVDILVKDKLTGEERIRLYLVGKLYAKEAGLAATGEVENKELMDELGIPKGSLYPWLKALRDRNMIKQVGKERHVIPMNLVERTLKSIEEKLKKGA
jgi:hypothetical protein